MASSEQDGTALAAAAQQFGSMSLGKSVERKDTENNENKNETPTKLCSACGKESDALKKCTACKCVWYCDKDCQKHHRGEHKEECRRIKKVLETRGGKLDVGTEKDIGPLGKLPPREECPICMRAMPIHEGLRAYSLCCGKMICAGCGHQHKIQTRKANVTRAQMQQPPVPLTCAFCREPRSISDEEMLARLSKRVELKDPLALCNMGLYYRYGGLGLPADQTKCIDLLRESAGLGCSVAQYQLGAFHSTGAMGIEKNEEEELKYWKKAAEGGDLLSQHNLGGMAHVKGEHVAAMRHWRLSASGGFTVSMCYVIECFEKSLLHHGDLAETLQAFYLARAELRSENRDQYIAYLKRTGEYEERFDL